MGTTEGRTGDEGDRKPSPVELIKEHSNYLRGDITKELAAAAGSFSHDSAQLLKHHGTYQQDDRDQRAAAKAAGDGKAYIFMVRTKIPGGRLTRDQLLAELDLCERFGNQTLRITSRQGLQLHGVVQSHLQETIRAINECRLTTLGACGDVNRNVMCCPAPRRDPVIEQMNELAVRIADHFAPRSAAYREIWLQEFAAGQLIGEKTPVALEAVDPIEPIYGKCYLPRKFKMGIALPSDNCIDVYTHDLGLLAIPDDKGIVGYNVLVGGGFGVIPSAKKTFPALGKELCFATVDEVLSVIEAVVAVQRDFGNRSDRKLARLKYLIADCGIDTFRLAIARTMGTTLAPSRPVIISGHHDHIGWEDQGDGHWSYGLNVENGRILDHGSMRLKSAVRTICQQFPVGIRLTAHQSILFTDIPERECGAVETVFREHGVKLSEEISQVRRWSMACVAWPTCGLSITEAERALPGIIDQLEKEFERLDLSAEELTVRMTGCPNGCARPYNADIGLVGRAKGRYTIYLGGSKLGTRLNFIYQDMVDEEKLLDEIVPLLAAFRELRVAGESFGDFCHRHGVESLWQLREQFGVT